MTQGPFDGGGISVTIKGDEPGGKFNDAKSPATWMVFHGTVTQVKDQIIEAFGMDASAKEQTLLSLQNEATKMFKAVNAVGGQLGGTVLNTGQPAAPKVETKAAAATPQTEQVSSGGGGNDVWAQANQPATEDSGPPWDTEEKKADADPILSALENSKTVAEVQQIWAENQSLFAANAEYMSAYKARGKALS